MSCDLHRVHTYRKVLGRGDKTAASFHSGRAVRSLWLFFFCTLYGVRRVLRPGGGGWASDGEGVGGGDGGNDVSNEDYTATAVRRERLTGRAAI